MLLLLAMLLAKKHRSMHACMEARNISLDIMLIKQEYLDLNQEFEG